MILIFSLAHSNPDIFFASTNAFDSCCKILFYSEETTVERYKITHTKMKLHMSNLRGSPGLVIITTH